MKRPTSRKRHRPEEVVAKLRQADESLAKGVPIAEVARSLGVSEVTLHRWRAEYGAVDRDAVRRLKELERESSRLKLRLRITGFCCLAALSHGVGGILRHNFDGHGKERGSFSTEKSGGEKLS